jgi:hypothetical protein
MLPVGLPDPGKSPVPTRTVERWDTFIGDVASGMEMEKARKKCYVTRADIETMCRKWPLEKQRFREARSAGLRTKYSEFQLQEIFALVAGGEKVADAYQAVMGTPHDGHWLALVNQDPDLKQMYRDAKGGAVIAIMDDVIDIADDKSGDILLQEKGPAGNMAAVSRDKLRTDVRFRHAGLLNAQLFGERKDQALVQINLNYAERLEDARARASQRGASVTKTQMQNAIEATVVEVDTSWMDDKPTDAVWREES